MKQSLSKKLIKNGFSLVEIFVGLGLLSALLLGIINLTVSSGEHLEIDQATSMLSQKRLDMQNAINSDAAWIKTVSLNDSSSHLGCMSQAGCVGVGASNFSLFEANGSPIYITSPAGGFNSDGSPCVGSTRSPCAFQFSLQWTPHCGSGDPKCSSPYITVTGIFTGTTLRGAINLAKYGFNVDRQAVTWSPCQGPKICGAGLLKVCLDTGWSCAPSNPPYCFGLTNWSVGGVNCSTNVAGDGYHPGLLHNTLSTPLANTAPGNVGSAQFLCLPGQPNRGFIVQAGATCAPIAAPSPSPTAAPTATPGLCGPANGGSYSPVGAAALTTSDLCSAGTPSVASLSGNGPWSWNCAGVACNALQNAWNCYSGRWPTGSTPGPPPLPTYACEIWCTQTGYSDIWFVVSSMAGVPPAQFYGTEPISVWTIAGTFNPYTGPGAPTVCVVSSSPSQPYTGPNPAIGGIVYPASCQ